MLSPWAKHRHKNPNASAVMVSTNIRKALNGAENNLTSSNAWKVYLPPGAKTNFPQNIQTCVLFVGFKLTISHQLLTQTELEHSTLIYHQNIHSLKHFQGRQMRRKNLTQSNCRCNPWRCAKKINK